MEADRDRVGGNAQDDRDLGMAQPFPGHQAQELLVLGAETLEGGDGGPGSLNDRDLGRPAPQPVEQADPPAGAAPLVREHAPGDRVEPGEVMLFGRRIAEATPGDDERLRGGLLGVGGVGGPPQAEGKNRPLVGAVQPLEGSAIRQGPVSSPRRDGRHRGTVPGAPAQSGPGHETPPSRERKNSVSRLTTATTWPSADVATANADPR